MIAYSAQCVIKFGYRRTLKTNKNANNEHKNADTTFFFINILNVHDILKNCIEIGL